MSRVEFMRQLEALLKDISADERAEALQYYNDYFDDAGAESEEYIITKLGTPEKVAAIIKAGLKGANEKSSQYSETGYTDIRFEEKESPANWYAQEEKQQQPQEEKQAARTNTPANLLLIVLITIIAAPIAIPVGFGLLAAAFGMLMAFFVLLISLVIISVALTMGGLAMFVAGITHMFVVFPVGLALGGAGLILFAIGAVATVFSTKLCGVVIPSVFIALVNFCRRPFKKREVPA